jgi:hypothetical protein
VLVGPVGLSDIVVPKIGATFSRGCEQFRVSGKLGKLS